MSVLHEYAVNVVRLLGGFIICVSGLSACQPASSILHSTVVPYTEEVSSLPPTLTRSPVPTATETKPLPTFTSTSTATITATLTPVQPSPTLTPADLVLTEWKGDFFKEISQNCRTPESTCWIGATDGYANDMSLKKEQIDIASDWANPYLVFWHKYKIGVGLKAEVIVESGGNEEIPLSYKSGIQDWSLQVVDLTAYRGKRIKIGFKAPDGIPKRKCLSNPCTETQYSPGQSSTWIIQDIRIIPNYKSNELAGSPDYTPPPPAYFSSNEPFRITQWSVELFQEITQNCYLPDLPCWWGKTERMGHDLSLTGKDEFYVASHWPNPYLVYWTRYDIEQGTYAIVVFKTRESDEVLLRYEPGSADWFQEAIDLSPFSGDGFSILFIGKDIASFEHCTAYMGSIASGTRCVRLQKSPGAAVEWAIQDIHIVPDYKP